MTNTVGPTSQPRILRVLVVDDAPDIRALIRAMLSDNASVEVLEASGGEEALAISKRYPSALAFLLDGHGPGIAAHVKRVVADGSPRHLAVGAGVVATE